MPDDDFHACYAVALRRYASEGGEASRAAGHDLGLRALQEQLTVTEVVEGHFRLVSESETASQPAALQFLLHTLATFDLANQGALDGTRRYEQQRARADHLADRDAFRTALVNSLQEGFFVIDHAGTIIEINEAFTAITGSGTDGLPYEWPYPWLIDHDDAAQRLAQLVRDGSLHADAQLRGSHGRVTWAAVSVNSVAGGDDGRRAYVGTIRDVTAARASFARESAVVRLATTVGIATTVAEVMGILLDECRTAIDLRRVVSVTWPETGAEPVVQTAGSPDEPGWRDLDPFLRAQFDEARGKPPLSVWPIGSPGPSGQALGLMAVLSGAGRTALWLEHGGPRVVSDDDRLLVTALIGHLSLAVAHVRQFEAAREASLTLQRSMLPTSKPPVGFAVRYEPAVSPLEIGGDWYDVLNIGEHHIGIIVGDCVGSGLGAAAVMGQLRSSARVLLINGTAPARLLEELDSAAALIPGAYFTTVFVGTIDTDTGAMTYSSAGHVPALLAAPGATPETLTGAASVPLAVERTGPRPEASIFLSPSSTLMLYTDGLVERRECLIDDGIERAGRVLADTSGSPAEAVADAVLRGLAPVEGFDDDVAIVVYRRPPASLQIEVVATPDRLSEIRGQLGDWLWATGIPDDLAGDIVLVVNEACSNSIEHAYRSAEPGLMVVYVEAKGRGICIQITDFGSWKPPDTNPRVRGRGVPLMRAVSRDVTLEGTPVGTRVTMEFQLA